MQTAVALDVTDVCPSPLVLTVAVKLPPTTAVLGTLVTVGVVGGIYSADETTRIWAPSYSLT